MNIQTQVYADGIEDFIAQCNEIMYGEYHRLPVRKQRALYEKLAAHFNGPIPTGVKISETDFEADGLNYRFRTYRKTNANTDALVFYIRGGGFVLGSLETHHVLMADICAATGLDVVAADFRLSPEAPFPAALEDCETVLEYVAENAATLNLNRKKILICGDSSGGNMATALCMRLRDSGTALIDAQVLFNPVLDFSRWKDGGADVPLLTAGEMEFYTACYAPGDVVLDQHVSPLVSGSFEDLPPAYIMAAELDSLKEDSVIYAEKLTENGIAADVVVEPGLVHGGLRARNLSKGAMAAFKRGCEQLVVFANT